MEESYEAASKEKIKGPFLLKRVDSNLVFVLDTV